MTVQLTPEQEQVVEQAIQAGLIADAEDVVASGVEAIRKRLQAHVAAAMPGTTEQRVRALKEWVHSHSSTTPLLSDEAISLDSIYGNRGM